MRRLQGPFLATATVTVGLVLAEVVAHVSGIGLDYTTIHRLDPELIFTQLPDAAKRVRVTTASSHWSVVFRTNSLGFRGDELLPSGAAPRVVVYGDSFVAGEFCELEKTFAERLEAHLAARLGRPAEAVNAGIVSYGPDQILAKMRRELPDLEPDLVVIALFAGNDYGDLMRNKMYRLGEDGSVVPNAFRLSPDLGRSVEGLTGMPMLYRIYRRGWKMGAPPERHAPTRPAAMRYWLGQRRREYVGYVLERDDVVHNARFDSPDVDLALEPEGPAARYKVELMRGVLRFLQGYCDERGVPVAFVVIPHPMDVSAAYSFKIDERAFPTYDRDRMARTLEELLAAQGSHVVGLLNPFRAGDVNELYLDWVDGHWSEAGQELAARLVATSVLDEGLLEPGAGRRRDRARHGLLVDDSSPAAPRSR